MDEIIQTVESAVKDGLFLLPCSGDWCEGKSHCSRVLEKKDLMKLYGLKNPVG